MSAYTNKILISLEPGHPITSSTIDDVKTRSVEILKCGGNTKFLREIPTQMWNKIILSAGALSRKSILKYISLSKLPTKGILKNFCFIILLVTTLLSRIIKWKAKYLLSETRYYKFSKLTNICLAIGMERKFWNTKLDPTQSCCWYIFTSTERFRESIRSQ